MEITVKIEGLDQLSEAMALLGSALAVQRGETVDQAVEKLDEVEKMSGPDKDPEIKEKAAKAIEDMAEVLTEKGDSCPYTFEDLQRVSGELARDGKRDGLSTALKELGVPSVLDIKEDQYGAFAEKLKALGGVF